jgi:hypothetical protein
MGLLRCRMQHCCVYLIAGAEEFADINLMLGIQGKAAGLDSALEANRATTSFTLVGSSYDFTL